MASFRNFASCLLKNSENFCAMGRFLGGSRRPIATSTIVATQEPPPKTDKRVKCTLIPGDGVGPELCESVKEVFKAVSVPIEFEELFLSEVHSQMSVPIEEAIKSIRETGVALRGPLMSPFSTTGELQTLNMTIRKELDLFANVVHVRTFAGVKTRHSRELDFVIIREQTEGEYSALEHESVAGVIECLKIVTREKSEKIAKFAFDYATRRGRKKVTAVHKANIMKLGDGLFLRSCEEVSKLYPQIKFDNMIIDNTCMQLVSHPEQFDVMVMPNLYGNIIDNLAAGIVGGAGLVPGASYSADCVIHEPGARHAFGEAVGKNIANPTAMLFCAVGLLRHVNLVYFANLISEAVEKVLKEGKTRTRDLGGYASTTEFTQAVITHLPH